MSLTKKAYAAVSDTYERSLSDGVKKENGVFYTDLPLAEKMLRELALPPGAVVMDPCCGAGAFLYAAYRRGHRRLYGVDCDAKVIDQCRRHLPGIAFSVADSIGPQAGATLKTAGLRTQPDALIGNPPYVPLTGGASLSGNVAFRQQVARCGSNLFVAALLRAFDLVQPGGIISYIVPKNLLHVAGYSELRRLILTQKTILSIVDLGAYFKNVRGEQIVLTLQNAPAPPGHGIRLKRLEENRFAPLCRIRQSSYTDEILLFDSAADRDVYRHLTSNFQTLGEQVQGMARGRSNSGEAVTGKNIRKFGYKDRALPQTGSRVFIQNIYSSESGVIAAFGGELEAAETVTVLSGTDPELCRYLLGILHSRLCNLFLFKYCYNSSRLTMHADAKYLSKLPLPPMDRAGQSFREIVGLVSRLESGAYMSRAWMEDLERLHQAVYTAYGLTREQADEIDRAMMKVQSRRWFTDGRIEALQ